MTRLLARGSLLLWFALTAVACAPAPAPEPGEPDIVLKDAWARATPPGAQVAGGYITLRNEGDAPDRLLSVRSPLAREVQIHEVSHQDGVARMRMLHGPLAIAPDSTVVMAPGGMHLMFLEPAEPLVEGTRVPLTLEFERAGSVEATLRVRAAGATTPGGHGQH